MERSVKLHAPTFGEEEISAMVAQMRTGDVTMGRQVRRFEQMCAEYFGVRHCVMCNSGSSANLLAVAALSNPAWNDRLKPGDEVIVPALSWATSVWPLIQHGLVPVFVDCDINTFNVTPQAIEAAITDKTKAIMLVHVYGNPCHMNGSFHDGIMQVAGKHGLYVIEDSCESMGAGIDNKYTGSFGIVGTMSLYYSHHITTFEGGLCLTDNAEFADLMRILRAHGWSREADNSQKYADLYPNIDPRFLFVNIGYNLRPTEIQAAMGMVQLPKLYGFVQDRCNVTHAYRNRLERYSDYFILQQQQIFGLSSWFGFGIILKDTPFTRAEIVRFLNAKGIETRPIIAGNMARQPAMKMYEHRVSGSLENSNTIMDRGFAIGCHQGVSRDDCEYVGDCFDEFMLKFQTT
jgi:CDP-6-deoxy-D-xylo-4-hexulose-3-dehydrase